MRGKGRPRRGGSRSPASGGKIRVQRGELRGRILRSPDGGDIRPMGARLRCKVIDALGQALDGARVHDLCSGTGAQSIEALSVGAAHVTLVDKSPAALELAKENLELFGDRIAGRFELRRGAADRALEDLALAAGDHDDPIVIFVSPPYAETRTLCTAACRAYAAIVRRGRDRVALVLQHSPRLQFELPAAVKDEEVERLAAVDRRTYVTGDSQATIFRVGM